MDLTGLLPALLADPAAAAAVELVRARGALDVVGPAGVRPPLLAAMAGARREAPRPRCRPLVVVTATGRDADELAARCGATCRADDVAVLPAWETLPHERLSPRSDTVARRLAVFRRLAHPDAAGGHAGPIRVLVMPVRALLQPVVDGPRGARAGRRSARGRHRGPRRTSRSGSSRAAYTRVDMVERRGEFAVRGGILDVFPPTEDHPLRVEFWGDEVEEIRWFAVADQRSLEVADHGVWAPPCREILLTDAVRARAAALVRAAARRGGDARPARARASRSRAWSRSRPRWSSRWCPCSTWWPTTPARGRGPGAGAAPRARPRRHHARSSSPPRGRPRPPGGRTPIDLSRGVVRDVRGVRARRGPPRPGLVDAERRSPGRRRRRGRRADDFYDGATGTGTRPADRTSRWPTTWPRPRRRS